ncbi:DUF2849 domain-containing protein [Rhodoblastus acidophilus]|uniref:DUF2849 domain-containing protein n=1 Tax=Candidatus Rhodoblastus alkanivorans TaxID=2954117 RepID=A0ABS9ZAT6_9HYPH|nr:DUF2849 domain-containing protein [Candidatus Rhodoblastus alkanivorans]MCI4678910.1 DUF2849 domain-containing protein [Candidatus Rhodoblastus alkanivorans]MCI4684166.1 DUF2849 domain-containing protein [Candidatus Rhodoblastus alkanivorans]MDI4641487.1 DUF2849 domain-containing protein [Rhodoblastus acidophilus]
MAAPKRPNLPAILVASDLLEGEVVFAAEQGWTRDLRQALVASDELAAQALERFGATEFLHAKVVDPYLVAVETGADGAPRPRHYREVLRALGPSVRPDLGKQADFQI